MDQLVSFGNENNLAFERLLKKDVGGRILLVTGKKSFETSGAQEFILNNIPSEAIVLRYSDFENNPNITDLLKGIKTANDFNPSVIIAIGGGSVIDMGKLIRFFYTHSGEILTGPYVTTRIGIPLIAIPTTAGTGCEATHFAVLYDDQKKKHSIANNAILPDCAIINPVLTYNQTPYLTACSGFDALAQAIEAYWNKNATTKSDEYAQKAINLIYDTLPKVVANPTPDLRDRMAEGAYWAGKAINITKTTAPHAFSYPFTAFYGIPHGHAVAIVFPYIADFNLKKIKQSNFKIEKIKELFGLEIVRNLQYYCKSIGLHMLHNQYDMGLLKNGINIDRLKNNPVEINEEQALNLLSKIIS